MSRTIAIATAAIISMGVIAASASSASAGSYGHQSHSCHTKAFKVPAWKTVWRYKKVHTSCGWETRKVRKTIKVWRTKYKTICH